MEYKFRGKRIDSGEWIYGEKLTICGKVIIVPKGASISITADHNVCDDAPYGFGEVSHSHEGCGSCWPQEVHPDSVGQWTGLEDIDDDDWYCGDIGEFPNGDRFVIKIEWYIEFFADWIGDAKCEEQTRDFYRIEDAQKIGNVTDNPELLGEQK